jgi:beta-phosphoglucomutase-like phosphatase (HAD superfamily)
VIRALLWDVDGTLAETERDGHLVAFNRAFAALEVPWRWSAEHYGRLLAVAGGHERLLHDMQSQPQAPAHLAQRAILARAIHRLKNEIYAAIVRAGELPLRAGVTELMADCLRAEVAMGIATTSSRRNVEALLGYHLGGGAGISTPVVSLARGATKRSRVYHLALAALRLQPAECVAVEDAPAGVGASRRRAGWRSS